MANQRQNRHLREGQVREGQQGGPAQNDDATQHSVGAERDLDTEAVVQDDDQREPLPKQAGAGEFPDKIRQDPNRDLSNVPGTFNPGNQAGKPVEGGGQVPAGQPGGPPAQQNQKR